MGKGKGRQSGGFSRKSERAAYRQELQQQVSKFASSSSRLRRQKGQEQKASPPSLRPRLRTGLSQLKCILRERRLHDSFLAAERRRRNGFLPRPDGGDGNGTSNEPVKIVFHPPGWIVNYGKPKGEEVEATKIQSLQGKCLSVLADCILGYLEAMGSEDLHRVLSFLPSDTLAELSVAISSSVGVTNELAVVLGKHPHVESIAFRAADQFEDSISDDGLLELVPLRDQSPYIPESWEDTDEGNIGRLVGFDMLQVNGFNLRLKRLELIDCQSLSVDALVTFFERCSCITHLSLAGSLASIQDGSELFRRLPELLHNLQVLDVTRCTWISTSALDSFVQSYYREGKNPPVVHCEGCFSNTHWGTILD